MAGGILVFDIGRRQLKTRIQAEGHVYRLDFSPSGGLVACASRAGIKGQADLSVYDLASGARVCQFPALADRVNALHFLRGGRALLASTFDGVIGVWGVVDKKGEGKKPPEDEKPAGGPRGDASR